jgi:hypothetical protein
MVTAGCAALRPATVPLRTIDLARGSGVRCLVVLLPGRWNAPEQFRDAGFASAVARRGLPVDLVAVDSHLGYFRDRTVIERLRADVVLPARAAGYDTIWLAGTSLGGIGALFYLRDHPQDLAGVLAIAPYLGEEKLIREIERAGGPGSWQAPATVAAGDAGRELWSWLAPRASEEPPLPLHLGWGTGDDFDRSNRMLAGLLPPDKVYTLPGGHDWSVWERLWEAFLDRTRLCAPDS